MDLQTLRFIRQAIPVVGHHVSAYVDLVQQDIEIAKLTAISWLIRGILLAVSAIFALFFLCVLLIALAWDTEYRILSIGTLTLAFVLVSALCAISLTRKREKLFTSLRLEWHADKALLRTILEDLRADDEELKRRHSYGPR